MQHMLSTLRKQVDKKKHEQYLLGNDFENLKSIKFRSDNQLEDILEAQSVIRIAAELTQKQLQHRISEIITLALASIFPEPYTFLANFSQKRNNVECELLFERDGETMKPLDDSGFGAADIASLALRFSVWKDSGTRPTLFFDEPGRNLSKKYREAFGFMLKMLAEKLQVQVIAVTHMEEVQEAADKVFLVSCKNYKATVTEVEQ